MSSYVVLVSLLSTCLQVYVSLVLQPGSPKDLKFIAFYVKEDRVVAVASMQNDPVVAQAAELFRLGAMPSAKDVSS